MQMETLSISLKRVELIKEWENMNETYCRGVRLFELNVIVMKKGMLSFYCMLLLN